MRGRGTSVASCTSGGKSHPLPMDRRAFMSHMLSVSSKSREEGNVCIDRSLFSERVGEARPPFSYAYGGVWVNSRVLSVDPVGLEAFGSQQ
jgi:hypothetical protein